MNARKALIAWTPADCNGPCIEVGVWPDRSGWSDDYAMTGGACFREWHEAEPDTLALLVMLAFNTAVVRDGVPVDAAHEAFLKIDQYRERISPDTEGAA